MHDSPLDWRAALRRSSGPWRELQDPGSVVLSSFEDEAGEKDCKDPRLMFQTCATVGLRYTSSRFIDWTPASGGSPRTMHVEDMNDGQLGEYEAMKRDSGLATWSLGGRAGKAYAHSDPERLVVKSGTALVERTWTEYLDYVKRCAEVCGRLRTKLYRGFGFYRCIDGSGHFTEDRGSRRGWAQDRVGQISEVFRAAGILLGLECEPNLEYGTGWEVVDLIEALGGEHLFFVMDAGNMAAWGYSVNEILDMFIRGLPYSLWLHIKDYAWWGKVPVPAGGPLDEENLKHFCPCDRGRGGHSEMFYFLSMALPYLNARAVELGLPGFCCELETHLWGGGQFGGLSRHEGIGVGLDALTSLLRARRIGSRLRTYSDILEARGLLATA